jgi:hypothetical protein
VASVLTPRTRTSVLSTGRPDRRNSGGAQRLLIFCSDASDDIHEMRGHRSLSAPPKDQQSVLTEGLGACPIRPDRGDRGNPVRFDVVHQVPDDRPGLVQGLTSEMPPCAATHRSHLNCASLRILSAPMSLVMTQSLRLDGQHARLPSGIGVGPVSGGCGAPCGTAATLGKHSAQVLEDRDPTSRMASSAATESGRVLSTVLGVSADLGRGCQPRRTS